MSRAIITVQEEPEEFHFDLTAAVRKLITEDDEPVDNPFSEKQQRLLTEALYSSWTPPPNDEFPKGKRTFWAAANVGVFPSIHQPALAPDVFLSLDVEAPKNWHENRAYFFWEYGKAPEVVVELVSNRKGGELGTKRLHYARMGVSYYIVYDPKHRLSDKVLQIFGLHGGTFKPLKETFLARIGLGVTLWHGKFENKEDTYLRWCDQAGEVLLTSYERTALEAARADREAKRARQATTRAKAETARADKLAAKLRELGIDPEQL